MKDLARRVLYVDSTCYLDDSNGASVASRALIRWLVTDGWQAEVLTGTTFENGQRLEQRQDLTPIVSRVGSQGRWSGVSEGVRVTFHDGANPIQNGLDVENAGGFLLQSETILARFKPGLVIALGGHGLARQVRATARAFGAHVLFPIHNFNYRDRILFEYVDSIVVPSQFAANYYHKALGLRCTCLPNRVEINRIRAGSNQRNFLTYVNPSHEKGVFAFARIADELGRQRPDIPLLVVEGRGTELTLAECGLDLQKHGNVHLMGHTHDPRQFWSLTRLCLMPSLWWENQSLVAVEALMNAIPVIGSDRGGLPETLGKSGVVLPLPEWMTATTRTLASAEEVAHWVGAIIRLWDDHKLYREHCSLTEVESQRWSPENLDPQYKRFFDNLHREQPRPIGLPKVGHVVAAVPSVDGPSETTERLLRALSECGVIVTQLRCDDLDIARNKLVSDAIHDDAEVVLLLDPDVVVEIGTVLRILARPESVVVGICRDGGSREAAVRFHRKIPGIEFRPGALGLYPIESAGCEFLAVRVAALQTMIKRLDLPLCESEGRRGLWPFFQSSIVVNEHGDRNLLSGVATFFRRLWESGLTPLADASIDVVPVGRASSWSRTAQTWDQVPGMFDFASVYEETVAAACDNSIFVEIGCLAGRSTCYLATKIKESGKSITLYAIDTGRGSATDSTGRMIAPAVGGTLAGVLHRNLIGCGIDDLVIPIVTTSLKAGRLFPAESVDFCFIDADHSYKSVTADLMVWWPKVKPGGLIAGHDYRQKAPWLIGVTSAVHDFFGVKDASHPLCSTCWSVAKPGRKL